MENIGEKIIAAVGRNLFEVHTADGPIKENLIFVWSSGAAEQLEAVVEAHIEERVRIRLELDRQKRDESNRDLYP